MFKVNVLDLLHAMRVRRFVWVIVNVFNFNVPDLLYATPVRMVEGVV